MSKEEKTKNVTEENGIVIVISGRYECPASRDHYCNVNNTKNGLCPVCGKENIYIKRG